MPIFPSPELPYFDYNTSHTKYARENRKKQTYPERIVWKSMLRGKKTWFKFIRQKPLWPFIVDFYCSKLLLVIEIDGASHTSQEEYDAYRTSELEKLWIKVVRFANEEVIASGERVYEEIEKVIEERLGELWL